jgi:AcrR family transcriptional regulator
MLKTKAISEEQKALRRNAIIQSARELFQESRFQAVNMQDVATRAGMAKGTVFFYFKTKEELFLAYAKEEIFRWNDRFDEMLHEYRENRDSENFNVDDFIEVIIKSLGDDKVFLQLISILGGVLEHNVDFDVMLSYKKSLLGRMMKTGKVIEDIIPGFKPYDGIKLYHYAFFIVAGIYPMAEPSETVKKVIEVPGMEFFSIDFNKTFREVMSIVLRGWK